MCIATYNGEETIHRCLTLLDESELIEHIYVLDNGSADSTPEILQNFKSPKLRVDFLNENTGFAKGYNRLFQMALQDDSFILCLNQDVWFEPTELEKLLQATTDLQHWSVVSPVHLNASGDGLEYYFEEILRTQGVNWENNRPDDAISLSIINAACWLIHPKALKTIGGFDPIFHSYGEDVNWCQRSRLHEYPIYLCPSSVAVHAKAHQSYGEKGPVNRKVYSSHKLAQSLNPLSARRSIGIVVKEWLRFFKSLLLVRTEGVRRHGAAAIRLTLLTPKIVLRVMTRFYHRDGLFLQVR